jgi:cAMP-dependent protein kinase regulator
MNQKQLEQAQEYIKMKVAPVVEKMTVALMDEKPDNSVRFMIDWLAEHGDKVYAEEFEKLQKRPIGVETSESEEEDDEEEQQKLEKMLELKRNKAKTQRQSVSAEVYGQYNPKGNFKPKVVSKDLDTQSKIRELLSNSFLFRHLDDADMEVIVNAMEIRHFEAEAPVITQGEDGFELYIVGEGQLRCSKRFPGNTEATFLKVYQPGEYFGELALLYNVPRAASITAITPSTLYSLDRECFNHIVKDAAIKNRNIFEQFLSEVEVLQSLDSYERSKLCDCLKVQIFEESQRVINEGEKGNTFYLVIDGQAEALKINPKTGAEEVVYSYEPKMYFGELALLRDVPRAASIVAKVK